MRRTWLSAIALGVVISSQLGAQNNIYAIPCRVFGYRVETPSGEIDRAMVAWLFDEIPINADQRRKALEIVAEWRAETALLDHHASRFRAKVEERISARNAKLLELLTNDGDRRSFEQCVKRQRSVRTDP